MDFINIFFVNTGSKLSNDILQKMQLTENDLVHKNKFTNGPMNSFMLWETDEAEVHKTILSLKYIPSSRWSAG